MEKMELAKILATKWALPIKTTKNQTTKFEETILTKHLESIFRN